MSSTFRVDLEPTERYREIGRLGAFLWLFVAGWLYLGVATAVGVGIDPGADWLVPIVPPIVLMPVVFVGGRSPIVLGVSGLAALTYAGLGALNFFRAAAFERLNPGAVDVSGHAVSIVFIVFALATALWSFGAAGLRLRQTRRSSARIP